MRWRGTEKAETKPASTPSDGPQEKLLELAFRMGQGSVTGQATPQASSQVAPSFPNLMGAPAAPPPVQEHKVNQMFFIRVNFLCLYFWSRNNIGWFCNLVWVAM